MNHDRLHCTRKVLNDNSDAENDASNDDANSKMLSLNENSRLRSNDVDQDSEEEADADEYVSFLPKK